MNTVTDLLERAKCGTVIVELATNAAARSLFDDLEFVNQRTASLATLCLVEKRIIINPS